MYVYIENQNDPFYIKTEIQRSKTHNSKMVSFSIICTNENDLLIQFNDHTLTVPAQNVEMQGGADNFTLRFHDGSDREMPVELRIAYGFIQLVVPVVKANLYVENQFNHEGRIRAYQLVDALCQLQFSDALPSDWNQDIYAALHKHSTDSYEVPIEEDPYEGGVTATESVYQFANFPTDIVYLIA